MRRTAPISVARQVVRVDEKRAVTFWNRALFYVMMPLPFIDSLNGYLNNGGNEGGLSIGLVYRLFVVAICLAALCSGRIRRRTLGIFCAIILVVMVPHMYSLVTSASFLSLTIKTILPVICVETFLRSENNRFNTRKLVVRLLKCWIILFPLTVLVPFSLGIGFQTYGEGAAGYKGFYYAQNDLCFALVTMFFVASVKTLREFSFSGLLAIFMNGACLLLLGMKSGYILMVLAIMYCVLNNGMPAKNRIAITFAIGLGCVFLIPAVSDNIGQIVQRWMYFSNSSNSFSSFVSSGRIERIGIAATGLSAEGSQPIWFIFGVGESYAQHLAPYGFVEMDPFDVFFQFGFVGAVLLLGYYGSFLVKKPDEQWNWTRLLLATAFVMSFLAGHVVNSALSGMVLSVLCALAWAVESRTREDGSIDCK